MPAVSCPYLVDDNNMRVLGSTGLAEGVPEVLHALFKWLLKRRYVEDVVLDLVPTRGVSATNDGDCFLELATTSEEFTVEPNITREA